MIPVTPTTGSCSGMKGTMSEMELSILRQRAHEALKQKARRGELFTAVAVGYVRNGSDRIERDPDQRVREALALVFRKFVELQSVRQVHLWFRQEKIALPAVSHGLEGRRLQWKAPVYNTIHHILTNPIYAGAYAYGRSMSKSRIENGRKRIARGFRVDQPAWEVLLRDHHEGYIGWDAFERNQRLIKDNANGKNWVSRGAVRRGEALLAGLFRCGHCGRKLHVAYGGTKGDVARYHCRGASLNHGTERCISFGSLRVDASVAAEVIERIQPLGVEAAWAALQARGREDAEKRRQVELALQQARFEAAHARRQYDAVDPDNRLVAGELERRWNERLKEERRIQDELDAIKAAPSDSIAPGEREALLRLGADVECAWHAEGATVATRKRIVRMLIEEIVVRSGERRSRSRPSAGPASEPKTPGSASPASRSAPPARGSWASAARADGERPGRFSRSAPSPTRTPGCRSRLRTESGWTRAEKRALTWRSLPRPTLSTAVRRLS